MIRCGIGYDIHRLVQDRQLILGGVKIPYHLGLEGHSDADVLSHAIADALLGAICAGDIGQHFPNTDESIRNISSIDILRRVIALLAKKSARYKYRCHRHCRSSKDRAPYFGDAQKHLRSDRHFRFESQHQSDNQRTAGPDWSRGRYRRDGYRDR